MTTKTTIAKAKTSNEEVETKKKAIPSKDGRMSDGTFAKGNSFGKNSGGRPKDRFSHRAIAARRAEKNPARIRKDLDWLDSVIDNEESSPMEKLKAIEMKIKLFGGYDVIENKTELAGAIETLSDNSAINQLTREDLLKALKRKR